MIKEFNAICEFRKTRFDSKNVGLKVNDPIVLPVVKNLNSIKESLSEMFSGYKNFDFKFEYSKGEGNFPTIPHVSILPPRQTVSKGIYVVICFDKFGAGALVGCAQSVTHNIGIKTEIRKEKRARIKLRIDVDGVNPNTKYNNSFINPKEFNYGIKTSNDLLSHIRDSLDLALSNLELIEHRTLNIADRVMNEEEHLNFNPSSIEDGKEKISRQITARRGQKKFRDGLLKAYEARCAITGSNIECILEAAHIIPYKGEKTNHIQNGILLRSDIHLLFDLNLLTIDFSSYKIIIHKSILLTNYAKYDGKAIFLPKSTNYYPNIEALKYHNDEFIKQEVEKVSLES